MFSALEQEENRRGSGAMMRQPSARGSQALNTTGGARDPPQLQAGSEGYKSQSFNSQGNTSSVQQIQNLKQEPKE